MPAGSEDEKAQRVAVDRRYVSRRGEASENDSGAGTLSKRRKKARSDARMYIIQKA